MTVALGASIKTALSGMRATQQALQVTSDNITNANTDGYTRKIVNQEPQIVSGRTIGVRVTGLERVVDNDLIRQVRDQKTVVSFMETMDKFFGRTQQFFGTLADNTSIAHQVSEFGISLEELATTPESPAIRQDVINKAISLAASVRNIGDGIQRLREDADREISRAVGRANDLVSQIGDLNFQIQDTRARGISPSELLDRRDVVLQDLAKELGIKAIQRSSGTVAVFTETGRSLLDASFPRKIQFDTATRLTAEATYPDNLGGVTLEPGTPDITNETTSGNIGALLKLRDGELVDMAAQIDRLSERISETLNVLHNAGTAFPPPDQLTGTKVVSASDRPPMSGTLRVAALDADGNVVEVNDIALAGLGAPPTVGDLVAAIDAMANIDASIGADGRVVIQGQNGARVAFDEMDSAVTIGAKTRGVSHFLGLNDFYDTNQDYDRYLSDRVDSAKTPLGFSGTLTFHLPAGSTAVSYDTSDTLEDIAAAIEGALGGDGIAVDIVTESSGRRLRITDTGGENFYISDSGGLAADLNLRNGIAGAATEIALKTSLEKAPGTLSRARIADGPLAPGDIAISPGNAGKIEEMALALTTDQQAVRQAGGLPKVNIRLTEYAGEIISLNATKADSAIGQLNVNDTLLQSFEQRRDTVSKVNIDEELGQIILLQNAFNASARITTTISTLLDFLITQVR